jgi:hypothetical protein
MSTIHQGVPRRAVPVALLSMVSVVLLAVGVPARVDHQRGQDRPAQVGSVDFVLVTATGQPVPDLRADEITLRIDNKARPIRSLRFVKVASAATAAGPEPVQPVAPAFATSLGAPTVASRSIAIVVDDESMPIGEEQKLRAALNTFVSSLPPADRVALVTVPHGGIKVGLTGDHARLREAISQISPIQSIMDPTCRTRDTLATLQNTIGILARASEQPVVVAFLSASLTGQSVAEAAQRPTANAPGGVSAQGGSCYLSPDDFVKVGSAVAAARAQLYIIHPDFSQQPAKEGIENLRGQTGAPLFHLSAGTEPGLARMARETSGYYVATFDIDPDERTGVAHQASIRTTRQGVELRGRPYVMVGRAATTSPATTASAPIITTAYDIVRSGRAFSDLEIRATASSSRNPDGRVKVIGLFEPVDPSVKLMTAAAALFDENGMAIAYWQAEADKLTTFPIAFPIVVPPATYRMRIAAIDSKGRPGLVDDKVVVELQKAGPLQISGLVLGVFREGTFIPRLQFTTETRAMAYLELYGGSEGTQVGVVFEVSRTTDGPSVLQLKGDLAATSEEGKFTSTVTIPVGALKPGDWVIRAIVGVIGQPQGRVLRTLHKEGASGG